MDRVHTRTVLANFEDLRQAREAERRIRKNGLGHTQVDVLTDHLGGPPLTAGSFLEPLVGPDMDIVSEALGRDPDELLTKRPRLDEVLLTVVTEEEKVPAVVSIVKATGGAV